MQSMSNIIEMSYFSSINCLKKSVLPKYRSKDVHVQWFHMACAINIHDYDRQSGENYFPENKTKQSTATTTQQGSNSGPVTQ